MTVSCSRLVEAEIFFFFFALKDPDQTPESVVNSVTDSEIYIE